MKREKKNLYNNNFEVTLSFFKQVTHLIIQHIRFKHYIKISYVIKSRSNSRSRGCKNNQYMGHNMGKRVFGDLRPSKSQTGLLAYKS